jgi:hypothetical protein
VARRVSVKGKGAELFFGGDDSDIVAAPAGDQPAHAAPHHHALTATEAHATDPATPDAPPVSSPPTSRPARSHAKRLASKHASVLAPGDASTREMLDRTVIEAIRRTVKVPGREVSYVRLTPEEKGQLTDIVYTYKRQGMKTSENEINRIAVNYMLADYQEHGEQSILAMVLAALQA